MHGHSDADNTWYVPKEEFEEWQRRDPIDRFDRDLVARGVLNDSVRAGVEKRIHDELESELEIAMQSPFPAPEIALEGVHRGGAVPNTGPELGTAGHCFQYGWCVNLVTMTRKQSATAGTSPRSPRGQWRLQDAKARFSEVVRLAHSEGPQRVTLHGRDAVVVVDAQEFLRLKGERMGQLLIDALQASPHRDIEIEPRRSAMPATATST